MRIEYCSGPKGCPIKGEVGELERYISRREQTYDNWKIETTPNIKKQMAVELQRLDNIIFSNACQLKAEDPCDDCIYWDLDCQPLNIRS